MKLYFQTDLLRFLYNSCVFGLNQAIENIFSCILMFVKSSNSKVYQL